MSLEPKITVTIPVGPKPHHKQWLQECIDSAVNQTEKPDEILIVSDMAKITLEDYFGEVYHAYDPNDHGLIIGNSVIRLYEEAGDVKNNMRVSMFNMPWLAGVVTSFNFGIALARNEWVLQLGSDDELRPGAIEYAKETIREIGDPLGLYNFSCQMMDTGEIVSWFNHANVVSKSLWKKTGGLNPMTVTGGMDAALISIMMVHMPQHLHKIKEGVPLYEVRQHEGQYTRESASRFGGFMVELRNILTEEWESPEWAKS